VNFKSTPAAETLAMLSHKKDVKDVSRHQCSTFPALKPSIKLCLTFEKVSAWSKVKLNLSHLKSDIHKEKIKLMGLIKSLSKTVKI
jgi:hypothetical protein